MPSRGTLTSPGSGQRCSTVGPTRSTCSNPSEYDLVQAPEDVDRYVLLTLPVGMLAYVDDVLRTARDHGLRGYSGVAGEAF